MLSEYIIISKYCYYLYYIVNIFYSINIIIDTIDKISIWFEYITYKQKIQ